MEVIPSPDPVRAEEVLRRIDELWSWLGEAQKKVEGKFMILAMNLLEAKRNAYWAYRGYTDESEWVKGAFPQSRTQYYDLIDIAEQLGQYPTDLLERIGSTKCRQLARVKKHFGALPENYFLHAIEEKTTTFIARVRSALSGDCDHGEGKQDEEVHFKTFKFYGDGIFEVNEAIKTMQMILGSDRSPSDAIRMICVDWQSGYRDDGKGLVQGRTSYILMVIGRLLEQLNTDDHSVYNRVITQVATWVEKGRDELSKTQKD